MSVEEPITLKEVQLRLGVPQHVLIHLCEKGVIEPDFAETSGRGKRREFSERNVFEFAIALALRRFELPVATTALVVRVIRSFVRAIAKATPNVELLGALVEGSIDLGLQFYDGELLIMTARGPSFRKPILLSADIGRAARVASPRIVKLDERPQQYEVCLDVHLSEIARRALKKPLQK